MAVSKIIVHTDIFIDYLLHDRDSDSALRKAMGKYFCYTTVFNAIELFSLASGAKEREAVERALSAMKILGLNAKHSRQYGMRLANAKKLPRMNGLIACMAIDSKLPILTGLPDEFKGMKGLTLLLPKNV
jgi:predicted nucleic acid-binding protein